MISGWLEIGGSVPRGFSRYYILGLLKEPHTGKEIINHAVKQSGRAWNPSPGLVYPLLGRLLDEQLIEETGGGRYKTTEKGQRAAQEMSKINDVIKKQLDVLIKLGDAGRFAVTDVLERIYTMGSMLSSNISSMTEQDAKKYRRFLESELEKLNTQEKRIKIA